VAFRTLALRSDSEDKEREAGMKRYIVLVPHQDATLEFREKYPDAPPAVVLQETDAPWTYSELKKKAQALRVENSEFSLTLRTLSLKFRQAAVANMVTRERNGLTEWKIGRLVWLPRIDKKAVLR
jgi:hypothetical protein